MARIALISTAAIPTPPLKYGGIERSAAWVAQSMVEIGHEVYLFGHPESAIEGAAIYGADSEEGLLTEFDACIANGIKFDVILDFSHDKRIGRKHHGDIAQINNWQGQVCTWPINPVFISKAQAQHCGHPDAPVIYHGPEITEYPINLYRPPGGPLLYLGALTRHKSPHLVAEAAQILQREAYLVGPAWDDGYWPELDRVRNLVGVHVLEEVGGQEKIDLMHKCSVLVHPVGAHGWMEAGAVVALEAMLMGIPVVATPNGCLPEYVINKKTGYLCADDPYAIKNAVLLAEKIKPTTVLANYDYGRTRFYSGIMYAQLIERVLQGETW